MASVIAESVLDVAPRLLTVADVAALPDDLPSGSVKYELDEGRLLIMAPPGDVHGASQVRVGGEFLIQGERRGHGKVRTEVGVVISRDPDTVFTPDALFIANRSLPIRTSREGYLETMPDIVVEVRSKNDSARGLLRKGERYLSAGVQRVWILDPFAKSVTVLTRDAAPVVLPESETLTAGEIIPDFAVPVVSLFSA